MDEPLQATAPAPHTIELNDDNHMGATSSTAPDATFDVPMAMVVPGEQQPQQQQEHEGDHDMSGALQLNGDAVPPAVPPEQNGDSAVDQVQQHGEVDADDDQDAWWLGKTDAVMMELGMGIPGLGGYDDEHTSNQVNEEVNGQTDKAAQHDGLDGAEDVTMGEAGQAEPEQEPSTNGEETQDLPTETPPAPASASDDTTPAPDAATAPPLLATHLLCQQDDDQHWQVTEMPVSAPPKSGTPRKRRTATEMLAAATDSFIDTRDGPAGRSKRRRISEPTLEEKYPGYVVNPPLELGTVVPDTEVVHPAALEVLVPSGKAIDAEGEYISVAVPVEKAKRRRAPNKKKTATAASKGATARRKQISKAAEPKRRAGKAAPARTTKATKATKTQPAEAPAKKAPAVPPAPPKKKGRSTRTSANAVAAAASVADEKKKAERSARLSKRSAAKNDDEPRQPAKAAPKSTKAPTRASRTTAPAPAPKAKGPAPKTKGRPAAKEATPAKKPGRKSLRGTGASTPVQEEPEPKKKRGRPAGKPKVAASPVKRVRASKMTPVKRRRSLRGR